MRPSSHHDGSRVATVAPALAALFLFAASVSSQPPGYTVLVLEPLSTEVGDLGNVNAVQINDRGDAIGQAHGQIPGRIAGAAILYTPEGGLENLDPSGNFNSATWQLNNAGLVYGSDFGNRGQSAIFLYDGSGFDFIAEGQSEQFQKSFAARAMNDDGVIVGQTGFWANGQVKAWRYTPGSGWEEFSRLDARLGRNASGELINNNGDVVFVRDDHPDSQAFLLTAAGDLLELGDLGGGVITPLAMNGKGQVAGYSGDATASELGFLFTPGRGLEEVHRDGFLRSQAMHVNPKGVVAGVMEKEGDGYDTLFVRRPGRKPKVVLRRSRFERFADQHGVDFSGMDVQAINDALQFVGSVFEAPEDPFDFTAETISVPYLYSKKTGMVSLRDVVGAAVPGWTATEAWDINPAGQILVAVTDGERRSTAILTPVE